MARLRYLLGGFLFSGLLLWLLLRNVGVSEVEQLLRVLNRQYLLWAVGAYVSAILLRSLRWQLLLASLAPAPYSRVVVALVAGYTVNNLLPARLGEIFRASLAKSQFGLPISSSLGTIAIERTMDGLTVVLLLGLGLLSLPVTTEYYGLILGVLAGGISLFSTLIACLYLLSGTRSFRTKRIWGFSADKVAKFRQGLSVLRSYSIGHL
jgi:glycosyltransferase 2 family protein